MRNGTIWKDIDEKKIHAHGGHILKVKDSYYWYGENREDENYINCYRSENLKDWHFCTNLIHTATKCSPLEHTKKASLKNEDGTKINLERPKIIYNKQSKKYILWMHYENGHDYLDAGIAIATSDYPDKNFEFHGYFRPFGYMSRDCTIYQEDDKGYFISAANDNADLHVYSMSDDYLNVSECINQLFIGRYREAPVLFKENSTYYLVTSGCSSWDPNQAMYSTSKDLAGKWTQLKNLGDETTYNSQPAFALKFQDRWWYFGDRWGGDGEKYFQSSYVVYPLELDSDENMQLIKTEEFL